jgi:voltage-gated potassium channel
VTKAHLGTGIKRLLVRYEGLVETAQFLLSALAVILVVSNEFVGARGDTTLPFIDMSWTQAQVILRTFIWATFLAVYSTYTLASGRPFRYAREHVLELLVCLTWIPFYDGVLFRQLHTIFSLDMLLLIGSVVHGWRVARWTVKRFAAHPLVVLAASVLVLIASASPILVQVEPQTFPTLEDAAWFCVQTITTVGYGDLSPHTSAGKIVAVFLMVGGVGLGMVFLGTVSKMVAKKLLEHDPNMKEEAALRQTILDNNRLLTQLLAEQQETNRLLRERAGAPADDGSSHKDPERPS